MLKSVQKGGIDSREPRKTTVRQGGQEISRGAEQPPIAPYPRLQAARTQRRHTGEPLRSRWVPAVTVSGLEPPHGQ